MKEKKERKVKEMLLKLNVPDGSLLRLAVTEIAAFVQDDEKIDIIGDFIYSKVVIGMTRNINKFFLLNKHGEPVNVSDRIPFLKKAISEYRETKEILNGLGTHPDHIEPLAIHVASCLGKHLCGIYEFRDYLHKDIASIKLPVDQFFSHYMKLKNDQNVYLSHVAKNWLRQLA